MSPEMKATKRQIKTQFESGTNSIVTRSKCPTMKAPRLEDFSPIERAIIGLHNHHGSNIDDIIRFVLSVSRPNEAPVTKLMIMTQLKTLLKKGKLIKYGNNYKLALPRALPPRMTAITSITNCGHFMHIVVLTYSWIQVQELGFTFDNIQDKLNEIRLMSTTHFFELTAVDLKKPNVLKSTPVPMRLQPNVLKSTPVPMRLRCYGITKPSAQDVHPVEYVNIAHYFAVLTDGETGVLYNAYGSDLTKNPGYSMNINLEKFYEFIIVSNDPEGNIEKKKTGYKYYFLRNEIDYLDEEEGRIITVGDRHEYEEFVSGEPNLRIYEIDGYQKKVQEALKALINAPEPPRGGQKRKSKRKKRSRRTRRRKTNQNPTQT